MQQHQQQQADAANMADMQQIVFYETVAEVYDSATATAVDTALDQGSESSDDAHDQSLPPAQTGYEQLETAPTLTRKRLLKQREHQLELDLSSSDDDDDDDDVDDDDGGDDVDARVTEADESKSQGRSTNTRLLNPSRMTSFSTEAQAKPDDSATTPMPASSGTSTYQAEAAAATTVASAQNTRMHPSPTRLSLQDRSEVGGNRSRKRVNKRRRQAARRKQQHVPKWYVEDKKDQDLKWYRYGVAHLPRPTKVRNTLCLTQKTAPWLILVVVWSIPFRESVFRRSFLALLFLSPHSRCCYCCCCCCCYRCYCCCCCRFCCCCCCCYWCIVVASVVVGVVVVVYYCCLPLFCSG